MHRASARESSDEKCSNRVYEKRLGSDVFDRDGVAHHRHPRAVISCETKVTAFARRCTAAACRTFASVRQARPGEHLARWERDEVVAFTVSTNGSNKDTLCPKTLP